MNNFYYFIGILALYCFSYFVGLFIGKYGSFNINWSNNIHIVEKLENKIKLIELEIKILEDKKY